MSVIMGVKCKRRILFGTLVGRTYAYIYVCVCVCVCMCVCMYNNRLYHWQMFAVRSGPTINADIQFILLVKI